MAHYKKLHFPPELRSQVQKMNERDYCRRMYFGPSKLMNFWHRKSLENSLNLLPIENQHRVLDVGCSDGMLLFSLERYAAFSVGLDFVVPMLKWARRFAPENSLTAASGLAIPFADESFDRVFCLEVLEHVTDPSTVVREIARVMCSGGMVVFTVPIEIGPPLLMKQLAAQLLGWNRGEQYTWGQLLQAGLMRSVRGLQHRQNHFGFDYRAVERVISQQLKMVRRAFLPLPCLGRLLNLRAAFVATK